MSLYTHFYSILVLIMVIAAGWGWQPQTENPPLPEKPNIIVMYSDDHTAQAVGAYHGSIELRAKIRSYANS